MWLHTRFDRPLPKEQGLDPMLLFPLQNPAVSAAPAAPACLQHAQVLRQGGLRPGPQLVLQGIRASHCCWWSLPCGPCCVALRRSTALPRTALPRLACLCHVASTGPSPATQQRCWLPTPPWRRLPPCPGSAAGWRPPAPSRADIDRFAEAKIGCMSLKKLPGQCSCFCGLPAGTSEALHSSMSCVVAAHC